ncbi:hypothetical protein [Microbacterium sp.]
MIALEVEDGTLARLVADAPPLSAATRERLSRILRPALARPQGQTR